MKHTHFMLRKILVLFTAAMTMALGAALYFHAGFGSDPVSTLCDGLYRTWNISRGAASFLDVYKRQASYLFPKEMKPAVLIKGTYVTTVVFIGLAFVVLLYVFFYHTKCCLLYTSIMKKKTSLCQTGSAACQLHKQAKEGHSKVNDVNSLSHTS